MADVRMDAAAVRALARRVLDSADRIDEMDWVTTTSERMTGSSVAGAGSSPHVEERLADLVAHLRAWAAAAQASAQTIDAAQSRHAQRFGVER